MQEDPTPRTDHPAEGVNVPYPGIKTAHDIGEAEDHLLDTGTDLESKSFTRAAGRACAAGRPSARRRMCAARRAANISTSSARGGDACEITIAERHPDIRACLTDHVIFLDGGNRTLPMPNLKTLTVEQADALVAQLRNG